MLQTALRNKKGVTLVEVMIALVILLVVFMGLIQASLLSIENTATTALRDEAVRLASETVTALRTGPPNDLDRAGDATDLHSFRLNSDPSASATERGNATRLGINTVRGSRNLSSNYVVTITIDPLGSYNKQVTVEVNWDWKERTFAGGNPNSHKVVVLLRNT
jgi:prepilin-type N-terminal cleavage/methylation domain-containing protein